jgi:hypothetical protein
MDKDTNLVPPLLIAVFLVVALGFVGTMDYAEALTADAINKDRQFPAWMVIPYTAVVCDTSNSRKKPACCYYVPTSEYPRTGENCYAKQGKR